VWYIIVAIIASTVGFFVSAILTASKFDELYEEISYLQKIIKEEKEKSEKSWKI